MGHLQVICFLAAFFSVWQRTRVDFSLLDTEQFRYILIPLLRN